jgi:hypothetical protein
VIEIDKFKGNISWGYIRSAWAARSGHTSKGIQICLMDQFALRTSAAFFYKTNQTLELVVTALIAIQQ